MRRDCIGTSASSTRACSRAGLSRKSRRSILRSSGWRTRPGWEKSNAIWKSHRDKKSGANGNGNNVDKPKRTTARSAPHLKARSTKVPEPPDVAQLNLTHQDRVMFPKVKLTKGDL